MATEEDLESANFVEERRMNRGYIQIYDINDEVRIAEIAEELSEAITIHELYVAVDEKRLSVKVLHSYLASKGVCMEKV